MTSTQRTGIIAGGGAAGIFAAIQAAEANPSARILVLEKSREPLAKVSISGGGRCNVTHACFDPAELVSFYPRGHRELLGLFHRWAPQDTMEWFESRGVPLKTEPDGRIFPVSNQSADIVQALLRAAAEYGVIIRNQQALESVCTQADGGFEVGLTGGDVMHCDALMLATGGNQATRGYALAAALGHTIEEPVPSLFTLHSKDPRISGLQGISMPTAHLAIEDETLSAKGPLLITHEGFSGPVTLRLSAWGARSLADRAYVFQLRVRWNADATAQSTREEWALIRRQYGRKNMRTAPMSGVPRRLWAALLDAAGIPDQRRWSALTRTEETQLTEQWLNGRFRITGKSLFKEEFVTCGGVPLGEVDFRHMESRRCPGLFFGGEILDIDGLTGGFNLQAAWATGHAAGHGMALYMAAK